MQDIDRKADTELSGKELPCSWRECLSNTSKTVSLLDVFSQGSARDGEGVVANTRLGWLASYFGMSER